METLRNTVSQPDTEGLRQSVIREIKAFEDRAGQSGLPQEQVIQARYVLCTALDEMISRTPWGSEGAWGEQDLLLTFHRDRKGGEKFFLLLDRLLKSPATQLNLLELMYTCLALGFEGRYAVVSDGRRRLDDLRDVVYGTIRTQRGQFESELSPHWEGVSVKRNPIVQYVPMWVLAAVTLALLFGAYVALSYRLNQESDPVLTLLTGVAKDAAAKLERPKAPPPLAPPLAKESPSLRDLLRAHLDAGLLKLRQDPDGVTLVLQGDGVFASGSAEVKPESRQVIEDIARALDPMGVQVTVTGHSDSVPIRTPRYPSNWHLSEARANAVRDLLLTVTGPAERFRAEGKADTEPVTPDAPATRALNRRVEITLVPTT
jgi:type VI secretion system protein ImpK